MIYRTDKTLEEWCESKKICVKSGRCGSCKKELDTILPIETKDGYGLIAEANCCDIPRPPYTVVFKDEDSNRMIFEVMDSVLEK